MQMKYGLTVTSRGLCIYLRLEMAAAYKVHVSRGPVWPYSRLYWDFIRRISIKDPHCNRLA